MSSMTKKYKMMWMLVLTAFFTVSLQAPAMADIVTTDELVMEAKSDSRKAELKSLMLRDDVAQQLVALGVDVNDAQQRIDNLSDAELAMVYDKMDELPAGQAFGVIIALLVIFILLDIAGVTDIFPAL